MYILPVINKAEFLAIGVKKSSKFHCVSKESYSDEQMLKWLEKQLKNEKEFIFL